MKGPVPILLLALTWAVCAQAQDHAAKEGPVFTPARIEQDLVGKAVGPEAVVKSSADSSSTYVTVPLGMVFDETNITSITVLDTKVQGDMAQVVVLVDTVSDYGGRLRLHYELIAGDWILRQIENLDFRQR